MTAPPLPTTRLYGSAIHAGLLALLLCMAVLAGVRLAAQIEGDRGIAPIASSRDIQTGGIAVNTTGRDATEARAAGWKLAITKAWEKLGGPAMSDDQINGMVSAVVVEHEQIGPRRYIATLGVIFDRSRAGQYLAGDQVEGGARSRSAPMLVIPILHSGGVSQVFEVRGPWQRAWAMFQASASQIDYVRPSGSGADSVLLTAGQAGRRSRTWWRHVLDQYGAADVLIPVARIERQWPGGPVRGTFTARYGPDNTFLESFTMTANNEAGVPAMLARALVRMDSIYSRALDNGLLRPDPSLMAEQNAIDAALTTLMAALRPDDSAKAPESQAPVPVAMPTIAPVVSTFVVQFASPDAAAVDAALGAVRSSPGVQGASTNSIAIGGTSVMRVTTTSDLESLAASLRSRGWRVQVGANALNIRK